MGLKGIFFNGSGMSEAELLERVENRKGILYKTAFLYVRNKEDALDILHETIYKAYLSYGKLKMDEKQREIVILKYFNGLTLSEIYEILDCPIGTVKSHLHKALGMLRIELMEECINGA